MGRCMGWCMGGAWVYGGAWLGDVLWGVGKCMCILLLVIFINERKTGRFKSGINPHLKSPVFLSRHC